VLQPPGLRVEGRYFEREYAIGTLTVAPLTPLIGAVVGGVDPRRPLSPSERRSIEEALARHKVLFFRGWPLSVSQLVAFARTFGPLQSYGPPAPFGHPSPPSPPHPEVWVFEYGAERAREAFWHFDVLPTRRPARGAMLRARAVPEVGGDTLFCDMTAVYESLPHHRRARLEGAVAVYDMSPARRLARYQGKSEDEVMSVAGDPLVEIPLVRSRPPNGDKCLVVNPDFLVGIRGLEPGEAEEIALDLRLRIGRPDFQCRFRWQPDDLAFWDNRACLHYATNNYFPERRVMERVTLIDDENGPLP
jgi:taurine dioxygenase